MRNGMISMPFLVRLFERKADVEKIKTMIVVMSTEAE
jgi:hypothetical protein